MLEFQKLKMQLQYFLELLVFNDYSIDCIDFPI